MHIEFARENLKNFRLGKIEGFGKTSYSDELFVSSLMHSDQFLIYVLENGSLESQITAANVFIRRSSRHLFTNRKKYFAVAVDILSKISADNLIEKVFCGEDLDPQFGLKKVDLEHGFRLSYKFL